MLDKIGTHREQIWMVSVSLNGHIKVRRIFILVLIVRRNRFLPHEVLPFWIRILNVDWQKDPNSEPYKRYFGRFTQHINQQVKGIIFQLVFQNLNLNYFTLDIDSSVITRYGEQEGAKRLQS